ncbi:purine permease 21 [Quercus suber]|uniref:Purine permease 21 n=1 Tax=Quercus suber TaxID=58331 RepID=A0AAW0LRX1_QUESU
MATFVQSAGFPILLPLLFFFSPSSRSTTSTPLNTSSTKLPPLSTLAFLCFAFGPMLTGDNLMYSHGLLYLPVSTYSLLCATQLAFNALFSFFFNSQKFTPFIFNSLVLLTISATLLAVNTNSENMTGIPKGKTFASGEWKILRNGMENYGKGRVSYMMTLIWTAVTWQISSIAMLGLIFEVSSLFCNVISTLAMPAVPILAVMFFHDKMDGVKVTALLAVSGFLSYIYQHYLDDSKSKVYKTSNNEASGAGAVMEVC